MSFISSLFCCFGSSVEDADDVTSRSRNNKNASRRLAPAQSTIQKSLSQSISERHQNPSSTASNANATHAKQPQQSPHAQKHHANSALQRSNGTSQADNSKPQYEHAVHQSKPSTTEMTAVKDSSDSSKDTQSVTVHEEATINENSEDYNDSRNLNLVGTFHDDSTGDVADNEQEHDYGLQETEANSISSSSSEEFDRGEELDLSKFQPGQSFAASGWLLDAAPPELAKRKCLILDLDETLVHSSFKYVRQADFVIPVEIEGQVHNVYVIKRPGVDEFLKKVALWYEVVVFTASVSRYGDPLLDILDKDYSIHHRLFRDSCYNYQGNFIKNLSQIGRDLKDVIIIDNSPASYIFHPQHAVPISSWFSDTHDCELLDILPLLHDLSGTDDVRLSLDINL